MAHFAGRSGQVPLRLTSDGLTDVDLRRGSFQINWSGFSAFEISADNASLDFVDDSTTHSATLQAGLYTPDELAAETQRAMREANTDNNANTCTFDSGTGKFTLAGTAEFSLLWQSGSGSESSVGETLGL